MRVGDKVEDFSARDQDGTVRTLGDLVSAGPVVLFFYPKAMTPG
jgi:peroxiredoxin Q/BCP